MTPTWAIPAAFAVPLATWYLCRWYLRRRADREYAADVARRVRQRKAETEMLERLYAMESAP